MLVALQELCVLVKAHQQQNVYKGCVLRVLNLLCERQKEGLQGVSFPFKE